MPLNLIDRIRAGGFAVMLCDEGAIEISPASRLDAVQRAFLRAHKAQLVEELKSEEGITNPDEKQSVTAMLAQDGDT